MRRNWRVVSWKSRDKDEQHYTLVMEVLSSDGTSIKHDMRYQMDAAEFTVLKAAVNGEK